MVNENEELVPTEPEVQTEQPTEPAATETQTGEEIQPAAEVKPDAEPDKMIPKERLDYVLEKSKAQEQYARSLEAQIELIKRQSQPEQEQFDPLSEIPDEGLVEAPQVKKVLNGLIKTFGQTLGEMQFRMQCPDYDQLVGTPQKMGEPLQKLINERPDLAQFILTSPNPKQAAYQLTKFYVSTQGTGQIPTDPAVTKKAEKVIANAKRPISVSAVGGSAAISAANRFANMTDEELDAEIAKVKEG